MLCTFLFIALFVHRVSALHSSNWAVLIDASRYWFNYRHVANTVSIYRTVKRLGLPDSNILLFLADDVACNTRNTFPGVVYNDRSHALNLYGDDVEVDYRGYDVTVENVMRVLTGRHRVETPRSQRLLSDESSKLLIYITGHGGDEFLKFQDKEELMAQDVADAVAQMAGAGRFGEVVLMVETCQASTMYRRITSPGVLAMGSSKKGESSYSHHNDPVVGLSVVDRFTHDTLDFMEAQGRGSQATLADMLATYTYDKLHSTFRYRTDLFPRRLDHVKVAEFFGSAGSAHVTHQVLDISEDF